MNYKDELANYELLKSKGSFDNNNEIIELASIDGTESMELSRHNTDLI
jgi:hypothetical protein